ncbi:hypothetical protein BKA93DRAFT_821526 [Sparassis latifolia]|uniref:Hyaluronan/mRNA-binding protein domain-containing protein n=1 Tax=Sparassis crispa TaxID=139825 RepID=A0A401GCE5_9APHY|nr:predicted protein [Sparassis crispa]GBE79832.1 predicted protein [Sparassis crispa]
MTRTARASFPRAILKDRAESKSGMDKRTPKNGAGPHNWGALVDERELEDAADMDEELEHDEFEQTSPLRSPPAPASPEPVQRRTLSLSDADLQSAREFRKKALRSEGIDLSAIARTSSAVSSSPTQTFAADIESSGMKSV